MLELLLLLGCHQRHECVCTEITSQWCQHQSSLPHLTPLALPMFLFFTLPPPRHLFHLFVFMPRFHSQQLATPRYSLSLPLLSILSLSSLSLSISSRSLSHTHTHTHTHTHSSSYPCSSHHIACFSLSSSESLCRAVILRLPHVSGLFLGCPAVRLWFVSLELEGGQRGHGAQPHLHRAAPTPVPGVSRLPLGQFPVIYYSSLLCLGCLVRRMQERFSIQQCRFS